MPDTFFTTSPHWAWYIVLYFFVGGIAGGSFFIASILYLVGRPADRPIVRLGYYIAFVGAVISGLLLVVDLGRPERFWHMMLQSETMRPMLKYWSPMSMGVWGLLLFGFFAFLAAVGATTEDTNFRWAPASRLARGVLATIVAVVGGIAGFFLAGYTGVLLSVTNRPVWADSNWLGILFLFSAASTAAAALILLGRRRTGGDASVLDRLHHFDRWALVLELVVLIVFLVTLGGAIRVFLSAWGVLLLLGVIGAGILLPLAIGFGWVRRAWGTPATAAVLVLAGGLLLRVVTIISSEQVRYAGTRVILP
jgi:formate-dependent nitrite reductase membrane component NrfD